MNELPATFTDAKKGALELEITKNQLRSVTKIIAKGKAPGHDDIPVELFQRLCPIIGKDFHLMTVKSIGEVMQYHQKFD